MTCHFTKDYGNRLIKVWFIIVEIFRGRGARGEGVFWRKISRGGNYQDFLKWGGGLFLGHSLITTKWTSWVFLPKSAIWPPPPTIGHRSSIGGSWNIEGRGTFCPSWIHYSKKWLWKVEKKNNTKGRLNPYKLTRKARQKQLQSAGLLFPHMLQKIDLCVF